MCYTYEYPRVRWFISENRFVWMHEMTTQHIYNCIKMIQRDKANGRSWREGAIPYFKQELFKRGLYPEDPVGKVKVYPVGVISTDHIDLEESIENSEQYYRD